MKCIVPKIDDHSVNDKFALYPTENNNEMVVTEEEHLELYDLYSKIYPIAVDNIAKRYESSLECDARIAKAVVSNTLPRLLKIFFDVLFRIKKVLKNNNASIALTKRKNKPYTVNELIQKMRTDCELNAELIYLVGSIFSLEKVSIKLDYNSPNQQATDTANHNSRLYKRTVFYGVIARLKSIYFIVRNLFFTPRIGTLDESYIDAPMVNRGLYGKYFSKINFHIDITEKNDDLGLRKSVFRYEDFENDEIDCLLNKIGLNVKENILCKKKIIEYLHFYYPNDSLEMLPDYVKVMTDKLSNLNIHSIITGSGGGIKSACFLTLAKNRGIKIFRLQHGGYYGYNKSGYNENDYEWSNEFSICDHYLTWGWGGKNKLKYNNKFIPFTSPWLSDRKNFWKKHLRINDEKYAFDIVIAPTKLSPFSAPSDINSTDMLPLKSSELLRIVNKLTSNGVNVLYKSPSITSSLEYSESINKMKNSAGKKFHLMKKIDKGLTIELLEKAPIILWDTVGTGFLECMACGIPAMVYVSNYQLFFDDIIPMLHEMEKVGIVHRNEKTILSTVIKYNKNRTDWINNKKRNMIVKEFSKKYCNTSDNWDKELICEIQSHQ